MESGHIHNNSHGVTIKIQNFEGPFDLLFHLIEKNQMDIYDIPIAEITDQYMEYLFRMREMDMEIASEFVVMAANLLLIKSRMLLPKTTAKQDEEEKDPRIELVDRLVEYRKYKEIGSQLHEREEKWSKSICRLPEVINFSYTPPQIRMEASELAECYFKILERNDKRTNPNVKEDMSMLIKREKVSIKDKIAEIIRFLFRHVRLRFGDLYNLKKKSRAEVVTGFLAVLELIKENKVTVEQRKNFDEIFISRRVPPEQLAKEETEINQEVESLWK